MEKSRGTSEIRPLPRHSSAEYHAGVASTSTESQAAAPSPLGVRTAPALWRYVQSQDWDTPGYLEQRDGGWREVPWEEAGLRVELLAHALLSRGVRRGDAVAVLARTRLEWILLDWAAMSIGAVVVGLYPTSSAKECAYILAHSESVLVFVEDEEQRAKIASIQDELPALWGVIEFDKLPDFVLEGREHKETLPFSVEEAAADVQEDDLGTLIYTSGTTGPPKGCMLTHKNLVTAATRVQSTIQDEGEVVLLFLPLAHSFGRLAHQAAAYHGATVALVADVADVPRAISTVRPMVLPAVPRVYEKIHANVLGEIERSSSVKRALGRWALRVGAEASALERAGQPVPAALQRKKAIADKLVFAKVRKRLGGRIRVGVSGAAPLGIDVLEFFHAVGVLVIEGYGLTETSSSLTVNSPEDFKFGTVGRAVDGCEIKLDEDGEILTRSETIFTGYYKDPEATAAAFTEDGWFRTGDVGEIDVDGWVKITDRKKDLIITAGGKNIAPQNLENALKASRFVSQAIVVGDRRPYVVALITLDRAEVDQTGRDPQELIQEVVDEVNRDRVRVEQIKRFAILPRDFTQEDGELTPTLKVRRRNVHEHFAEQIEALYT